MRNPFLMFSKWIGNIMTVKNTKLNSCYCCISSDNCCSLLADSHSIQESQNKVGRIIKGIRKPKVCIFEEIMIFIFFQGQHLGQFWRFGCHDVPKSFRKHQKWIPHQIRGLGIKNYNVWICRTSQLVTMVKYWDQKIVTTFLRSKKIVDIIIHFNFRYLPR